MLTTPPHPPAILLPPRETLSDEALAPAEAEQILSRLKTDRAAAAGHLAGLARRMPVLAFERLVPGTVVHPGEMLERIEREQEATTRDVQRLDFAILETERRAALWSDAHVARVAARQAWATAKADVERRTYAMMNTGRSLWTLPQDEIDTFVVAVRDLHAAGRVLLSMVVNGDEKDAVRSALDQSARDRLQVRSAPQHLLNRVRPVPASAPLDPSPPVAAAVEEA